MNISRERSAWRVWRRQHREHTLGFVPTMGALHEGHRSLLQASQKDNERTVLSIFLNPTQFDQSSDLEAYPSNVQHDLELARKWGVDAVFLPDHEQIYPDAYRYRVMENDLSTRWCGAHRPGHFDGVLTVVMRLLNLVQPDRMYMGEKDYQQLLLVRGMVDAFFMETEIVACPTVREPDGLAMSSRNQRLSAEQRQQALQLQQILRRSSDPDAAAIELERNGFKVDYVEDYENRRLAAAMLGDVRLIDNVLLEPTVEACDAH